MNVLITGGSGFLGGVLTAFFESNCEVDTLGRTVKNTVKCDLSLGQPTLEKSYDCVVHAAGKAHVVPKNEAESIKFFEVNVNGTQNLLSALDKLSNPPKSFVFISSVSVYGKDSGLGISEDHDLLGETPYALSKIEAEKQVSDWCNSKGIGCLIFRLPLVIGKGAPGNLERMINGMKSGKYLRIAGGKAKKSVVLANDIAPLILSNLDKKGVYNLTNGYDPTFREIEDIIASKLGKRSPINIPMFMAKMLGLMGDLIGKFPVNSDSIHKITSDLTFSSSKAQKELNWQPGKEIKEHLI